MSGASRWYGGAVLPLLVGVGLARAAAPPAAPLRTGQTTCYGATGGAVSPCAGSGQDADAAAGVPWPEPRFEDVGEGVVRDRLTGLAWTRDADPGGGARSWEEALALVGELNRRRHLGHGDWRLPNVNELAALLNAEAARQGAWLAGGGFRNVRPDYYWSSTTYAAYPRCAWGVGLHVGTVVGRDKSELFFAWPVRDGSPGGAALPRTGQSACHDGAGAPVPCPGTGQDGETGSGVPWPEPRFAPDGEGALRDLLTGLVWSRDARAPGPDACRPGGRRTLQGALELVRCLNAHGYLGRRDWRLPNRGELASLVDRGAADSAGALERAGFRGVEPGAHWTSSSYAPEPANAWSVHLRDGAASTHAKRRAIHVWPVRGGAR